MAIEIIKDMGARLLIEKDGLRSVVSKEMFDQLLAKEGVGTDIASTRNLPSLTPVVEPLTRETSPDVISGAAAPIVPPLPLASDKPDAISSAAPATVTPVLKPTDTPDAVSGGPVDVGSLGSLPPPVPTSTKSMTRGEYNASIRDTATDKIATAEKLSLLDQEDAAKILATKEAEDAAISKADAERTQQREEEATERRNNYEEKKRLVKDFQDTKVSESDVFSMKTTLQIISAGIGNLISLRAGRAQDPMVGFKIIENAIDRDLQMQMKVLDKKGKDVDAQSGLISEFRGLTGDNESAYALAKATMVDTAKRKVDMVAKQSAGERAKLKLEALGTTLGETRDALLIDNAAKETKEKLAERGRVADEMRAKASRLSAYTGKRAQDLKEETFKYTKEQNALLRADAKRQRDANKSGNFAANGTLRDAQGNPIGNYYSDDKVVNRAVLERSRIRGNQLRDLAELDKMMTACESSYDGAKADLVNSPCAKKIKTRYGEMFAEWGKSISGAAISDDEMKRLKKARPSPESWTTGDPRPNWKESTRRLAKQDDEDTLRHVQVKKGWQSATKTWVVGDAGKDEPELSSAVSNLSKQIEDTKIRNENRKSGKEYPETVNSRGMTGPKGVLKSIANTNLSIKQVWDEVDRVGDAEGSKDVAVRNKIGMESLVDQLKEDAGDNRTSIKLLEAEIKKLDKYINDPKAREKRIMLPSVKAKAERKERKERTQKTKKVWGKDRLETLARIRESKTMRGK